MDYWASRGASIHPYRGPCRLVWSSRSINYSVGGAIIPPRSVRILVVAAIVRAGGRWRPLAAFCPFPGRRATSMPSICIRKASTCDDAGGRPMRAAEAAMVQAERVVMWR